MKKTRLACISAVLCLLVLLSACGGSSTVSKETADIAPQSPTDYGYSSDVAESENSSSESSAAAGASGTTDFSGIRQNAKLILNAQLTVETRDFPAAAAALENKTAALEGYIESSETDGSIGRRSTYYTLRVPQKSFESMLNAIGEMGNVTQSRRSAEDVSESYADVETRLQTAKTKHERLLELLSQATTMSDIIDLENALSDTEYEIDSLTGTLRNYDSLVDYSTISVTLYEVQDLTTTAEDNSFSAQAQQAAALGLRGLTGFGKGFVLTLLMLWPLLLVLAIAAAIVIPICRRARKRRAANRTTSPTPPTASTTPTPPTDPTQQTKK